MSATGAFCIFLLGLALTAGQDDGGLGFQGQGLPGPGGMGRPPPRFGPPPRGFPPRGPPPDGMFGGPPPDGGGSFQPGSEGGDFGNGGNFPSQSRPFGQGQGGGPRQGTGNGNSQGNSATLSPQAAKYVGKDGQVIDGNGKSCNNQKTRKASKIDRNALLRVAKEMLITRTRTCTQEPGPPNGGGMGGGGRGGGRGGGDFFMGRRKRQNQMCSGNNIGNCDDNNSIESIYIEEDIGDKRLIVTNGIPDHCYKQNADRPNPNNVCEHYRAMLLPKTATRGASFQKHGMGPVGIAKSGAFFYNHQSAEQSCNVAAISEKASFDTCDGHPDPGCRYHYHKAPVCIPGFNDCELMGYMVDGFPVYGKCQLVLNNQPTALKSCYRKDSSKSGCDVSHYTFRAGSDCQLDQANGLFFNRTITTASGRQFAAGTYAYFFTPEYPFIMPGYMGQRQPWCVISPSDAGVN